jgi:hypothetical protein
MERRTQCIEKAGSKVDLSVAVRGRSFLRAARDRLRYEEAYSDGRITGDDI